MSILLMSNILGVLIFNINYEPKIREMDLKFKRWKMHNLSLKGKATIIKTFGISKLLYLASVLPLPPEYIISRINQLIYAFIWNNKSNKIKGNIMINTFEHGGLNISHFSTFCKALKVSWVKRYTDEKIKVSQWTQLINHRLKSIGGQFAFRCRMHVNEIKNLKIKSKFWRDVLVCWCEYVYTEEINIDNIGKQILWLNSNIKVGNKILYFDECITNRLWTLDQLFMSVCIYTYVYVCVGIHACIYIILRL